MSTQTTAPTVRYLNDEQANRVLAAYEWICSHADALPAGWSLSVPTRSAVRLDWYSADQGQQLEALAALVEQFGEPDHRRNVLTDDWSYAAWTGEGSRPEFIVQRLPQLVTEPAPTGGSECRACASDACLCDRGTR